MHQWTGDVWADSVHGPQMQGLGLAWNCCGFELRLIGLDIISRWPFPELRNGTRSPSRGPEDWRTTCSLRSHSLPTWSWPWSACPPCKHSSKRIGHLKCNKNRISTISFLVHVRHTILPCFIGNLCFQILQRNKAVPQQSILLNWSGLRLQWVFLFPPQLNEYISREKYKKTAVTLDM